MKKSFFIPCFVLYITSVTALLLSHTESSVEQLTRIMMSNTKHQIPHLLTKERSPNDYQDIYDLATKHQELLKGIIYDGQTFAMLCVKRGYADVLERLINEDCFVDLATPCYLYGIDEPETTVLHQLFFEVGKARRWKQEKFYSEDYTERITALTKLIISKHPNLLDIPLKNEMTAGNYAIFHHNLYDLVP
jgi:hypothetical protein